MAADLRIRALELGCATLNGNGYTYRRIADNLLRYQADDATLGNDKPLGRRLLIKDCKDAAFSLGHHDLNEELDRLWGLA